MWRYGDVVQVADPGGTDEPPTPDAVWITPPDGQIGANQVITLR
jgi:hypothetical protein